MELFHASPAIIRQFRPLTHFGSRAAALHRGQAKGARHIYTVAFDPGKQLRIDDLSAENGAVHSWLKLADLLHYEAKAITQEDRNAVFAAAGDDQTRSRRAAGTLARILSQAGWNSVVYRNQFEDVGSDSFLCLSSSQVRIVEVRPLPRPE